MSSLLYRRLSRPRILVVLLAVLRLSIEDAIDEFLEIWNSVFVDSSLDKVARSEKLERMMETLLERRGIPANRALAVADTEGHVCKGYVVIAIYITRS
jgi:hypothetical protein